MEEIPRADHGMGSQPKSHKGDRSPELSTLVSLPGCQALLSDKACYVEMSTVPRCLLSKSFFEVFVYSVSSLWWRYFGKKHVLHLWFWTYVTYTWVDALCAPTHTFILMEKFFLFLLRLQNRLFGFFFLLSQLLGRRTSESQGWKLILNKLDYSS